MAWIPINGLVPQNTESGNQSNGRVLKFYEPGTITPLAVATDSTGSTQTTEFVLDTQGYTTLSTVIVIPHVNQIYKVALYLNQTDADNNDTGSAVYVEDNVDLSASIAGSSFINTISELKTAAVDSDSVGNTVYVRERDATFEVVLSSTVVVDNSFVIQSTADSTYSYELTAGRLDFDRTITIGSGADYENINDALNNLISIYGMSVDGDTLLNLELQSGFIMQEQVIANGIDLSRFVITSIDASVVIDRQYLADTGIANLDLDSTPAFLAVNGGKLPIIGALFSMNTSGAADDQKQHGVMVAWTGSAVVLDSCGVTNATGRGLYGVNGTVYARNSNFSNAGTYGCRPGNSSAFNIRGSDLTGAGIAGLYAAISQVAAQECDVSNAGTYGLQAINQSRIHMASCTADNSGSHAFEISDSDVNLDGATADNAGDRGINIARSVCHANGVEITIPAGNGINAGEGAIVNAAGSTITGVFGTSCAAAFTGARIVVTSSTLTKDAGAGAGNVVLVTNGGTVISNGTTATTSKTPNIVDGDGVIYTDDVTRAKGSGTITSGAATVTVTHNLTVAPDLDSFQLTATNDAARSNSARVENVTGTTFDITTASNVGADARYAWLGEV